MVKFHLIPHEKKFYDLFEQSAKNLTVAAEKLVDLFENYVDVKAKVAAIKDLEHQGDHITHQIMESLHLTFVTPLDREDIALLANSLDDMMDFIEGATKRMILYRIDKPTPRSIELTHIINKVAIELNIAIPLLRNRSQLKQILSYCVEANRLENEADDVLYVALAELFDDTTDIREVIKWREIYESLESATDRGEDVANVLEGIVLKHA